MESLATKAQQRSAFLSYSRCNKEFAERLVEALRGQSLSCWADWQDIPATADWRAAIRRGIQVSENVIFLLTPVPLPPSAFRPFRQILPEWTASAECRRELAAALEEGKRLVPVLHAPCEGVPEALQAINWIYMREGDDFEAGAAKLAAALLADAAYVRVLTRATAACAQWEGEGEPESLLIGDDREVEAATAALQQSAADERKRPRATPAVVRYVGLSRRRVRAREKRVLAALGALAALAALLAAGPWPPSSGPSSTAPSPRRPAPRPPCGPAPPPAPAPTCFAPHLRAPLLPQAALEAQLAAERARNYTAAVTEASGLGATAASYGEAWADIALAYAVEALRAAHAVSPPHAGVRRSTANTLRFLLSRTGGASLLRRRRVVAAACPGAPLAGRAIPQRLSLAPDASDLMVLYSDGVVMRWRGLNALAAAREYEAPGEVVLCPPAGRPPTPAALLFSVSPDRGHFVALTCVTGTCLDDGGGTPTSYSTMHVALVDARSKSIVVSRTIQGQPVGFAWTHRGQLLMQDAGKLMAFPLPLSGPAVEAAEAAAPRSPRAARATIWPCAAGSRFMTVAPGLGPGDPLAFLLHDVSRAAPGELEAAAGPLARFAALRVAPRWALRLSDIASAASVRLRESDCGVLAVAVPGALHSLLLDLSAGLNGTGTLRHDTFAPRGRNSFTPTALAFGPHGAGVPPYFAMGTSEGAAALLAVDASGAGPALAAASAARLPNAHTYDASEVVNLLAFPSPDFLYAADQAGIVTAHDSEEPFNPGLEGLPSRLLRHAKRLTDMAADAAGDFLATAGSDGAVGLWRTREASRAGPAPAEGRRFFLTLGEPLLLLHKFDAELRGAASVFFAREDAWLVATANEAAHAFDMAAARATFEREGTNLLQAPAFALGEACAPGALRWLAPHPAPSLGVLATWCASAGSTSGVSLFALPPPGSPAALAAAAAGALRPAATLGAGDGAGTPPSSPSASSATAAPSSWAVRAPPSPPAPRLPRAPRSAPVRAGGASGLPASGAPAPALDLRAAYAAAAGRLGLPPLAPPFLGSAASPDGRLLSLADSEARPRPRPGTLAVFRVEAGAAGGAALVLRVPQLDAFYRSPAVLAAFSAGLLAVHAPPLRAAADGAALFLWRTGSLLNATGLLTEPELTMRRRPECPAVKAAAFSPDGRWLVTDDAAGRPCLFLAAPAGAPDGWPVWSSAAVGHLSWGSQFAKFSPDSRHVLIESVVVAGAMRFVLDSAGSPVEEPWLYYTAPDVRGGAHSADGAAVAVLSARDRTLRVHATGVAALARRACAMTRRPVADADLEALSVAGTGAGDLDEGPSSASATSAACPVGPWIDSVP
eukprot:tig00000630_g2686.t1